MSNERNEKTEHEKIREFLKTRNPLNASSIEDEVTITTDDKSNPMHIFNRIIIDQVHRSCDDAHDYAVEIKPELTPEAIGQALCAAVILNKKKRTKAAVAFVRGKEIMKEAARLLGVRLIEVDKEEVEERERPIPYDHLPRRVREDAV